jgi:hypothetical protein
VEPSVFSSFIFLAFVLTFIMHVFSLQNRKAVQVGDVVCLWSHSQSSLVYSIALVCRLHKSTVTATKYKIALSEKRIAEIMSDADYDTNLYPSWGSRVHFGKPKCSKSSFYDITPHLSLVLPVSQYSLHCKYETVTACLIMRNIW